MKEIENAELKNLPFHVAKRFCCTKLSVFFFFFFSLPTVSYNATQKYLFSCEISNPFVGKGLADCDFIFSLGREWGGGV